MIDTYISRLQRLNRLVKWLAIIFGPVVTITFIAIHYLIQFGHIQILNDVHHVKEIESADNKKSQVIIN